MNNSKTKNQMNKLKELVEQKSKHSDYQLLHPSIADALQLSYTPAGKNESKRQLYMQTHQPLENLRILDIGANTGYFSFAALESKAKSVVCIEGNKEHADFIQAAADVVLTSESIEVRNEYYNFKGEIDEKFDLILCLNVLHHLGDDFGEPSLTRESAKHEMISALNALSYRTNMLWFQLGFNWKGNRNSPLFKNGTKSELINFVSDNTKDHWIIRKVAVVDPDSYEYLDTTPDLLQRFDELGEFLNRPIFLMESRHV